MHNEADFFGLEHGPRPMPADGQSGLRSMEEVLAEWFERHPGLLSGQPVLVQPEVAAA